MHTTHTHTRISSLYFVVMRLLRQIFSSKSHRRAFEIQTNIGCTSRVSDLVGLGWESENLCFCQFLKWGRCHLFQRPHLAHHCLRKIVRMGGMHQLLSFLFIPLLSVTLCGMMQKEGTHKYLWLSLLWDFAFNWPSLTVGILDRRPPGSGTRLALNMYLRLWF